MPRREVLKFRRCLSGGDGFAEELRGHPEPAAEAVAEDVKIVGAAYHRLPQSSRSLAAFDVGKGEAGRRLNRLDLGIFNLSILSDDAVRRLGIDRKSVDWGKGVVITLRSRWSQLHRKKKSKK